MLKRKQIVLALLILGLASACTHTKVVEITSEPSGLNVEMDGAYLGKTPLKTSVTRKRNEWSNRIYASEVKASDGECSDTKTIGKDQETPDKMFFDLRACAEKGKKK